MAFSRVVGVEKPSVIQVNFPPVFGYAGLSVLLGKSVSTLQADRCRAPHKLPPACIPPNFKEPLFLLADVLCWLESFREPAVPTPELPTAKPKAPRSGRPSKIEQAEAKKLGISVHELRARRVEGGQQ